MKIKIKKGFKINSEEGDGHPDGTPVTIVCELPEKVRINNVNAYFVLFPDSTTIPVGIVETRVQITEESLEAEINDATIMYLKRLPEGLVQFF